MYKMRWSWQQLQATPWTVRQYCADFLTLIGEQQKADERRAQARAQQGR